MLHGIYKEMERNDIPKEMITSMKKTLDCNPTFRGHVVCLEQMIMVMVGSIVVFGVLYFLITLLPEKGER